MYYAVGIHFFVFSGSIYKSMVIKYYKWDFSTMIINIIF